jgi:hypothetical protein
VLDIAPWSVAVDQLGFVKSVETLGQGIVLAVALGPN